jgi:hypothetical protein
MIIKVQDLEIVCWMLGISLGFEYKNIRKSSNLQSTINKFNINYPCQKLLKEYKDKFV